MTIFLFAVINIVVKNRDDHAKNFSFIFKDNKWSLSPAYDITPSYGFNGNHTTTVLGNGLSAEKDVLRLADRIGVSSSKTKAMIEEIKEVVL